MEIKRKMFFSVILLIIIGTLSVKLDVSRKLFAPQAVKVFDEKVNNALQNRSPLDLREFDVTDWNEMAIIGPYASSHEIPSYEGPEITSKDDTEMYLVFLKDRKLQESIEASRGEVDFSKCKRRRCLVDLANTQQNLQDCQCPKIIPKEKALFWIDHQEKSFRSISVE